MKKTATKIQASIANQVVCRMNYLEYSGKFFYFLVFYPIGY